MLLKIEGIHNKLLKRLAEHCIYLLIVLVLIPSFFFFELCIVLPTVVEEWTVPYFIHLFIAHFILFNIISNMVYGMFTNTSIKGRVLDSYGKSSWSVCTVCECYRPPRAWHCTTCDICILKRDHHCTFFACCIGYYNHRYFTLFTFYVFVAMIYSFYYNVQFLAQFVTWNSGLLVFKFILPLASFALDYSDETLYVFLVVINFFVGLFTGFLFFYHFNNILKGRIVYEKNHKDQDIKDCVYNYGWRLNLIEVFGEHWYLTWISPFIKSPLPGDGIQWNFNNKQK